MLPIGIKLSENPMTARVFSDDRGRTRSIACGDTPQMTTAHTFAGAEMVDNGAYVRSDVLSLMRMGAHKVLPYPIVSMQA